MRERKRESEKTGRSVNGNQQGFKENRPSGQAKKPGSWEAEEARLVAEVKWWTPTRAVLSPQGLLSFGSASLLVLICLSLAYSNSVNRRGELSSLLQLFLFGMLTRIMNPLNFLPFALLALFKLSNANAIIPRQESSECQLSTIVRQYRVFDCLMGVCGLTSASSVHREPWRASDVDYRVHRHSRRYHKRRRVWGRSVGITT